MITFSQYQRVMSSFANNDILSQPINSLRVMGPTLGALFIKHDVEDRLDRAVSMGLIEAKMGHRATYYFQADLVASEEGRTAVQELAALGHEVGYHYDVLDAADGDYDAALEDFDRCLGMFANMGMPVSTVCPHGNPTKLRQGWKSNKDFFRNPIVRARYPNILDIVVDFPNLCPEGIYISDAGFQLRIINHIATNDQSNETAIADGQPVAWGGLSSILGDAKCLVLSVHPHRLEHSAFRLYSRRVVFYGLKKFYSRVKFVPFMREFANRFYRVTRRF